MVLFSASSIVSHMGSPRVSGTIKINNPPIKGRRTLGLLFHRVSNSLL